MQIDRLEDGTLKIDVREMVMNGEHPKDMILNYFDKAETGTVTLIHVPHEAQPLVNLMKLKNVEVMTEKIGDAHFCLHTVVK